MQLAIMDAANLENGSKASVNFWIAKSYTAVCLLLITRFTMSTKTKTLAFSVAALLAAGGGYYALMPQDHGSGFQGNDIPAPAQNAKPVAADLQQAEGATAMGKPVDQSKEAPAPKPPVQQAPQKLTKEQLMPPPLSENEKLDKAAQQESNF
jgi:hypothetical protein